MIRHGWQIRIIPAVLLLWAAMMLASCGGQGLVSTSLTGEQWDGLSPAAKVYVIESDRTAVLKAIEPYLKQPYCTEANVLGCKDRAVVEPLQRVDRELEDAMNLARTSGGDFQAAAIVKARQLLLEFAAEALAAGYGG